MNRTLLRRMKLATMSTLLAGGTLLGTSCTGADIQKNLVAGGLTYVKNGAVSFLNNFVPQDPMWHGFFTPRRRADSRGSGPGLVNLCAWSRG